MLKQLEIKTVDWNTVAGEINTTNAAAARKRWDRLKKEADKATEEGVPWPGSASPVKGTPSKAKGSAKGGSKSAKMEDDVESPTKIKRDPAAKDTKDEGMAEASPAKKRKHAIAGTD